MGGTVAQLMWKRHEQRVRGLVLAATAAHFITSKQERTAFNVLTGLSAIARFTPKYVREAISDRIYLSRKTMTWEPWATQQVADHDWRQILEAGAALGRYDARAWLENIDVPTSVIMTTDDHVVDPDRQKILAATIHNAHVYQIAADHDAVFARSHEFVPMLVEACLAVHNDALRKATQGDTL
jgi:3-oxoadipate enol-lactonase